MSDLPGEPPPGDSMGVKSSRQLLLLLLSSLCDSEHKRPSCGVVAVTSCCCSSFRFRSSFSAASDCSDASSLIAFSATDLK